MSIISTLRISGAARHDQITIRISLAASAACACKERDLKDGENWDETMFNVFRLDNGAVRHFWGSELTWAPTEPGRHHRSGDAVNALWGLLDMTPEGRGQFMPKLAY